MDFSLLINRKVIDILIGDKHCYEDYAMPYMKGQDLCELSTDFGLVKTYSWGGQNQSRWQYMQDLLMYLNEQERVPELLTALFVQARFENLTELKNAKVVNETYKAIVRGAIDSINAQLVIAKKELRIVNNKFVLATIGDVIIIETPKVYFVDVQYIRNLPERIKSDLENTDYDSVVTKSRTLLEEVFIFIIEQSTSKQYKSNGDLVKIYQDVTVLLNMRHNSDWDKRVNEMLGGLHKILSAIASMRNKNSDAHGVGSRRIQIKKREALLVANSAMMLAEYVLSVYEDKINTDLLVDNK